VRPAYRNNHLPKHHEELVDLVNDKDLVDYRFKKIALVYDVDHHPPNKVLRIASERVLKRGENHQSLRPDMADIARHELVIKKFQGDFVPPEGGLFDAEIKLSVTADLRANLQTAVDAICGITGRAKPDAHKIDEALAFALSYKPTVKKDIAGEPSKPPRYYALSVEFDLAEVARQILETCHMFRRSQDMLFE
jgi:tRNA ligase